MAKVGPKKKKTEDTPEIVKDKHPGGRPPKFADVGTLQTYIDEYFNSCYEEDWYQVIEDDIPTWKPRIDKDGIIMRKMVKPLTITGLAVFLDTTRRTLLDYEARNDEFSHTIKIAKARIENFTEEQLFTNKNTAGVIFNMVNNYGWTNKQEKVVYVDPKTLSDQQLKDLLDHA